MISKQLILGVILALSAGSAWAQEESEDEEEAKELSGFSVGADMRTGFESGKDVELEKPDFSRDFKMETPRPSMSDMKVQTSRPKLEVVGTSPARSPADNAGSGGKAGSANSTSPANPAGSTASQSASQPSPRPSGQTTDISPIRMDPPEYPSRALRQRQEGSVTLEFTVNENGTTENISVVSANPPRLFDREAIRAVADWKFEPAKVNGVPQAQRIRHTIQFTLN